MIYSVHSAHTITRGRKRLSERREMKGERIKALVDIMAESL